MFVLKPNPTFKVDVTIPRPGETAGRITVEFRHKGRKALAKYFEELTVEGQTRDDTDALFELIAGWSGIDVEFSKEALADLLDDYAGAARALFDAYHTSLIEGRTKN